MDTFEGFVRRVVRGLNRSGLRYALTGALASSYYGRPRTTLDIDVVIKTTREGLTKVASTLKDVGLRVEQKKLEAAWHSEYRITTIEDTKSPHTLDIIFTEGTPQRKSGSILGLPTFYQAPQSLILAKLRMIKATRDAERATTDGQDIRAILKSTSINVKVLRKKARGESTSEILEDLMHDR
jgi:hypothetical protein